MIRVLGISGSLRRDSHNLCLLRAAADLLPSVATLEHWADLKAIPPFDEDDEHAPGEAVEAWRAAIAGADALFFVTPEYNGSVPGQLKNALDWASRPYGVAKLIGKPVLTATELAVAMPDNPAVQGVRAAGRYCYPSANRAVAALDAVVRYQAWRRRRGLDDRDR